jgi:hypothetical protein
VPEKDRLWGQLHDGSEAYLIDLAKPIKMTKQMKIFRDTEEALQRVICEKFDLPPEMPPSVKEADWLMCCTESEQLMPPKIEPWIGWVEPLDIPLMCLPPDAAMEAFLRRFLELGGKVDGVDGDAITEFFERGGTAKARRGSLRSHHPDWPETLSRDLRRRCA